KLAVPATGIAAPTLWDAAIRADAAIVNFLEASPSQRVSTDLPKNFDYNLSSAKRAALKKRLGLEEILVYRLDALPPDTETRRKIFGFAKDMGVTTIVVSLSADLGGLDPIADESGVNVAVLADPANQARIMTVLSGHSKRIGIGVDAGL